LAFFVHRNLLFLAPLAQPDQVQRAVRRHPVEPCPEARPPVEFPQLPVGPQKRLLHQVFGIVLIARHTKRQSEHTMAMALHQHTKRVGVSGAGLCDCRGIALFPSG